MKKDIHPDFMDCEVVCSCGNRFTTKATVPTISVAVCSNCHPFYTGTQKLVDSEGRVDRFNRRYGRSKQAQSQQK